MSEGGQGRAEPASSSVPWLGHGRAGATLGEPAWPRTAGGASGAAPPSLGLRGTPTGRKAASGPRMAAAASRFWPVKRDMDSRSDHHMG